VYRTGVRYVKPVAQFDPERSVALVKSVIPTTKHTAEGDNGGHNHSDRQEQDLSRVIHRAWRTRNGNSIGAIWAATVRSRRGDDEREEQGEAEDSERPRDARVPVAPGHGSS
jgi:hypothetical protein